MPGAIRLRPDQEEDIPRVRDALRRTRRVLLQRPTGTGKTVLFCAITEVVQSGGAKTLILQHREELIDQTSRTLAEMAVEHGVIAAQHPGRVAPVQIASIATIARRLGAIALESDDRPRRQPDARSRRPDPLRPGGPMAHRRAT
jgi:DNA repair protein RadD